MIANKAGGAKVRLGGSIQPSDREEALEKLAAALDMGEELTLDLSGITEMDTQALQILLCIRKEAARQSKRFLIAADSAPVRKIAAAYNVTTQLTAVSQ